MRRLAQFDLKTNVVTKYMAIPRKAKRYRLELFYEEQDRVTRRLITTDKPYLYHDLQAAYQKEIEDFFPDDVINGGYKLDILE